MKNSTTIITSRAGAIYEEIKAILDSMTEEDICRAIRLFSLSIEYDKLASKLAGEDAVKRIIFEV